MYDTILVPTDGSNPSRRAISEAVALATIHDATIHGLYVVDPSAAGWGSAGEEGGIEVQHILQALEQTGERATAATVAAAQDAGIEAVSATEDGTPYRRILAYADDHDVDLIVMGTHGRRGLDRYLIGSTTERVIRRSTVPVLTVRTQDE